MLLQSPITQINAGIRGQVIPFPPYVIGAAGSKTIFDKAVAGDLRLQYVRIQNVGTGVVKVAINEDAGAENYAYCLRVDTGAEAGGGGACEIFGSWDISKITVFSAAGSKICVTKVVSPCSMSLNNY